MTEQGYLSRLLSTVLVLMLGAASCIASDVEVVAHGEPDEYYLGEPGLGYEPLDGQPFEVGPNGEQPKLNQDYVWGLAANDRYVWIGTGAGSAAAAQAQFALGFEPNDPSETDSDYGTQIRVTEFGASQYPYVIDALKPYFGDWRPPRVYQYDSKTGELFDRTPDTPLRYLTLGMRSCGVHNGVAILGGLAMSQVGICLFAFDAQTGEFLGSTLEPRYSNIRRWVVAKGDLYTSVLNSIQGRVRGSVLKWTGSRAAPFRFDVVGHLDNEGSYMAYHDGRLYVGTWPSFSALSVIPEIVMGLPYDLPPVCGIWMSPKIPFGGLRPLHQEHWKKVWTPETYEPDPILKLGYAMGAMESYKGKLYWGTMNFTGTGYKVFQRFYGGNPSSFFRTERSPLVLRCDNFDDPGNPTLELLYGSDDEWVFTPSDDPPVVVNGVVQGTWTDTPTLMNGGMGGLYGEASFGDTDNRYIWSSAVYKDQYGVEKLYFGTYDQEGLFDADDIISEIEQAIIEMREPDFSTGNDADVGADLYCFENHSSPAVTVTINAFEKYVIHGFRNMVTTKYGLFLGTANSQNLLFDRNDMFPDGGWELLKYVEDPPPPIASVR